MASAGWRRYGAVLQRAGVRQSTRYIESDGSIEPGSEGTIHYFDSLGHSHFTLPDGDEIVNVKNERYAFWLLRRAEESALQLREVIPINQLPKAHRIARDFLRLSDPDYLYRDSLLEVIKKPYFELISLTKEPTESYPNLHRLQFNYEHEYPGPGQLFNWPQSGTLWLDADNCWVVVRNQVEKQHATRERKRSYSIQEYEFADVTDPDAEVDGVRLPLRSTEYFELPPDWDTTNAERSITDSLYIPAQNLDPRTLQLSHFGYAEPDFGKAASSSMLEIHVEPQPIVVDANSCPEVAFSACNLSQDRLQLIRAVAC